MKIIKRSGTEVTFDIEKIISAIKAANAEVGDSERLTDRQVVYAAQNVAEACEKCGHTVLDLFDRDGVTPPGRRP